MMNYGINVAAYRPPRVISVVFVEVESSFLNGTLSENMSFESTGQEVERYSFSPTSTSFKHQWGD